MADKTLDVTKEETPMSEDVERTRDTSCYTPRADIREVEDGVEIVIDMPGVDDKSVDVTLEKNVLTIYGTVNYEAPDKYTPAIVEYGVGDYERKFVLSNEIDRDKIEAKMKNGVLWLHLPKAPEAQMRKISVTAS